MTDNKDKNPTTTRENAQARTNPKTIKERIKSFARRRIRTGNDRRTPVKLKKAGQDPVISALEKHEPRTYHPVEKAATKINPWRIPAEPKNNHSALAAPSKVHVFHEREKVVGGRESRSSKILSALTFLIPLLILAYIIYMNILPFGYTGELFLDIGVDGDMDSSKNIYLSDPNKVLTPEQRYGKETFREVRKNKPFYLNFYAPINIDEKTKVTLDMDYVSDSPVYIEYFDEFSNKTYWRRYYKPSFKPELEGYVPVAQYGDETIYAKRGLLEFKCRQLNFTDNCTKEWSWYKDWYFDDSAQSTDDWLLKNAKYESVYFYNRLVAQEDFINNDPDEIGYEEGAWTEINTSLRGTHELYVYLNNSLNLTIWKRGTDWHIGKNNASVELWNIDGTQLICMDVIPDDGIINKSSGTIPLVVKNTFCNLEPEPKTYLLKLKSINSMGQSTDYIIEKIYINTNKITTKGDILPVNENKLYTETSYFSNISYYYWHKGKNQNISVEGDNNQTISLSKKDRKQKVHKTLFGKNTIYLPKGDLWIYSSLYFSFNERNYFNPFLLEVDDKNPNYFIHDGNYKSWIYKEDNIGILTDNIKLKNIKLVFEHEPI